MKFKIDRYELRQIGRDVCASVSQSGDWCMAKDVERLVDIIEKMKACNNCKNAVTIECDTCIMYYANRNTDHLTDNWEPTGGDI